MIERNRHPSSTSPVIDRLHNRSKMSLLSKRGHKLHVTNHPTETPVNAAAAREANERGAALARQERYLEAAAALEEAFEFDPTFAEPHSNLGAVLRRMGDNEGAIQQFETAIRIQPDFAAAHYNLGNAYGLQGDKTSAGEAYRAALAYQGDYPEAWNNLARLLNDGGYHEEALDACLEGLKHTPDNPHLRNNAGNAYQGMKQFTDAIEQYRHAIQHAPRMSEAFSNLGLVLKEVGELDAAIELQKRAVELDPENVGTLNNLGTSQQASGQVDDAIATFEHARDRDPHALITNINLGTALMDKNEVDRAIEIFERIVDSASFGDETPEHALAHKNLGLSLMMKGEFSAGAKHYAWRWSTKEFTAREFNSPVWAGEPLNGETVFVHWEQGFGDAVQFARFASQIADRGGKAILEAPRPLVPLLETVHGIHQVIPEGEVSPETDLHIPMFDLLGVVSLDTENLPGPIPYLRIAPEMTERWEDRIPNTGRPRVGLVWAGRPTHRNDRNRSIPLQGLTPLLQQSDFDFYALQVGERVNDIAEAGFENDLIDLSPHLTDFAETAGALEQIDLLISVDTSVVHVAGATNRPAWVLIPYAPDWRWGLHGDTTLWYPSLKLWRQESPGEWEIVIARITEALLSQRKALRRN